MYPTAGVPRHAAKALAFLSIHVMGTITYYAAYVCSPFALGGGVVTATYPWIPSPSHVEIDRLRFSSNQPRRRLAVLILPSKILNLLRFLPRPFITVIFALYRQDAEEASKGHCSKPAVAFSDNLHHRPQIPSSGNLAAATERLVSAGQSEGGPEQRRDYGAGSRIPVHVCLPPVLLMLAQYVRPRSP